MICCSFSKVALINWQLNYLLYYTYYIIIYNSSILTSISFQSNIRFVTLLTLSFYTHFQGYLSEGHFAFLSSLCTDL